jgi:hypothetical protein
VHHFPLGPSLPARTAAAIRRWVVAPLRRRRALPVLVGLVVAVIALAVPVVSSGVASPVALDSSTSAGARTTGDSPVVMGVDGTGAPAGTGGATTSPGAGSPAGGTTEQVTQGAASSTAAPTGGSTQGGGSTPSAGTSTGTLPGSSAASSAGSSSAAASSSSSVPSSSETPSSVPAPAVVAGAGATLLAQVDSARIEQGCGPLALDPDLAATAAADSLDMATDGDLGSRGLVATGSADAATIVAGWVADATDSAYLLDCSLRSAGAAAATGSGSTWWALLLG